MTEQTIHSIAISGRVILNLHALNNEGSNGQSTAAGAGSRQRD